MKIPYELKLKIGKLSISAGWYKGADWYLISIGLLQAFWGQMATIAEVHILKFIAGIYWS